jgi:ABC-2 type transport system permease protein
VRVHSRFSGFAAIAYKEALHIRRDPMALMFALIMPLIQMVMLGYGIDTNVRQIKTVVLDNAPGPDSRAIVNRLRNSDTFRVVDYVRSDAELTDAIVSGRAKVGVKIPEDYASELQLHGSAQVMVVIDGSESSLANRALIVSSAIGLDESLSRVMGAREQLAVEMRPKMLFNPSSRSPNFFLPALASILLLNVTTLLTAFSIVREKERGTLEQLFLTPVQPTSILLGKITPYLGIGFAELCALVLIMRIVFQVPVHGHTASLLLLSIPYLFVSLSLGILISARAKSYMEALQMAFLTVLPSMFFSGYIFPRDTMPTPFYLLSFAVPATYFVNIARGIILRGAGLAHLWPDGLALLVMGGGILFVAARQFQKRGAN